MGRLGSNVVCFFISLVRRCVLSSNLIIDAEANSNNLIWDVAYLINSLHYTFSSISEELAHRESLVQCSSRSYRPICSVAWQRGAVV